LEGEVQSIYVGFTDVPACGCPGSARQWVIFPREGRLWNFGGTHKIHKRFLTKSTGSTCVGKEERQCGNRPHTSVLMDINKFGNKKSIYKVKFENHIGCSN